ncbi:hypothetical protein AVEN_229352-1 [Araneus ventricosus]|uniref:Transposable element Tc3 transposase n=1 Tax=Araneus ventricosus TaxID=182803 RepID=A0A4Y2I1S1_ARAVE|nr:hypothetical protein AVEN_229352-1 [Araneus ventricosus]
MNKASTELIGEVKKNERTSRTFAQVAYPSRDLPPTGQALLPLPPSEPEGILLVKPKNDSPSSNPYDTRPHAYQKRFSVNVWAGIVGDHLIDPYLLPFQLEGRTYLTFLQQVLSELLQPVAANIQSCMWFQHDGAPTHFSLDVRSALDAKFPRRWIGRGGPTHWLARSPDLSCLDFFVWGYLKSLVYESPIDSDEDLVARISVAAGAVREIPGMFEKVRRSLGRRCNVCITACGCSFEQFL